MPSFFRIRADSMMLNAGADDQLVAVATGQGAPSGSGSLGGAAAGIYIREDATNEDTVVYVTRDSGTTWKPLEAGGDAGSVTDLTITGVVDHDKTLTAAGDGNNTNIAVNHATANAEGIDLLLRQLTTARSAGTMSALKAAVTSLAGDTGGTYNNVELVVTDGGGTVTHNALKVGAGFDALLDVSAAATGQADVVVGDNLASAFEIREAANTYLQVVTTNGSEAVRFGQDLDFAEAGGRVISIQDNEAGALDIKEGATSYMKFDTTDSAEQVEVIKALVVEDAVVSGPQRRVGGQVKVITAAGTALTSSASEAVLASYSIPANTIKLGTIVRVRGRARVTADSGATTLTARVRFGATTLTGTVLIASAATDTGSGNVFPFEFQLTGRAAPGAAAAVIGHGSFAQPAAAGGAHVGAVMESTNFATNAALLLELTGQWSASDANSVQAEEFVVEIVG